ncbi:3-oxoacyl-[acyl-carrier-protein] synthase-3 [Kitasatospora sp. MAP12-15]|uniref:ketoacyl-ACP synthase III family protein n=1 Tax=unclassified Kitasatospora TaxID=2633591 RepID=UPI002474AD82|nr:ketoacyl-ACP synthase III family protein [Kitasatospora sp. MAP12-44]MDH6112506.1 3-oxoacyl-[acyl-carrier-protein] synthase-3 [Kitasatospora sp. MAP12-44]
MRWDNLYLAGLGTYLPERVEKAEDAVAAGRYDAAAAAANGIRAVRVADPAEAPPVMAAVAARQAVERSRHADEEFGLVVHACFGHQGQEFWQPASYVQNNSVGGSGLVAEVRQGSNGSLVALELAASWLAARPAEAALVTSADWFQLPYFDRWNSDDFQVYGDGAGAAVLSSRTGFARIRATVTVSDPTLESLYRGAEGWTTGPFASGRQIDMRNRKVHYLAAGPDRAGQAIARMKRNLLDAVGSALRDAGTDLDGIAHVVHPNTGEGTVRNAFYAPLGIDADRTVYEWGRDYGHIGAADQLVNLDHLATSGRVTPGDLVLVLGVGIGFTWSVMILEVLSDPNWAR